MYNKSGIVDKLSRDKENSHKYYHLSKVLVFKDLYNDSSNMILIMLN